MSLATLADAPCTDARLQVSAWGLPWGDVQLADETDLAVGLQTTLVLSDVSQACTIVAGGVRDGRAAYRVVGGSGGWRTKLSAKSYINDLGIRANDIITDAAREAGEAIESPPTTLLGSHFARATQYPAAWLLHALAPQSWYVGLDGVTRFGARTATAYEGDGTRTRVDSAGAIVEISTDIFEGIAPGVSVDGSAPASDVEYVITPERSYARVFAPRFGASRRIGAWSALVDALTNTFKYAGVYEFRIVTQEPATPLRGTRLNLQPIRPALTGLGDLGLVPLRPGVPGMTAVFTPGAQVLVAFIDRDPSRPIVVGFDDSLLVSLSLGGLAAVPLLTAAGATTILKGL